MTGRSVIRHAFSRPWLGSFVHKRSDQNGCVSKRQNFATRSTRLDPWFSQSLSRKLGQVLLESLNIQKLANDLYFMRCARQILHSNGQLMVVVTGGRP